MHENIFELIKENDRMDDKMFELNIFKEEEDEEEIEKPRKFRIKVLEIFAKSKVPFKSVYFGVPLGPIGISTRPTKIAKNTSNEIKGVPILTIDLYVVKEGNEYICKRYAED